MFLLRSAFWLTLVVMLIPADPSTGEAPRITIINAVNALQATVADISGFCGRNPDVCVTGAAAVDLVSEKAGTGVDMVQRLLGGASERDSVPIDLAPGGSKRDDGTLTNDDIDVPWLGDPLNPA